MELYEIPGLRLYHSGLSTSPFHSPADAVANLTAVQAQDFSAAKWSLGLRIKEESEASIEKAYNDGTILRVHIMRPTWHFVLPHDIRWMTRLTSPRVKAVLSGSNRKLGLDDAMFARSNVAIEKALEGHNYLTRQELKEILTDIGIPMDVQRLAHIIIQAELDGLICSGPMRKRQFTYALVEERLRESRALTREQSLAELARRYFRSHGPAQLGDFSWWSGLSSRDAGVGLEFIRREVERTLTDGKTYFSLPDDDRVIPDPPVAFLLSIYDEYAIAYADRSAISDVREIERMIAQGNAMTAVIILHGKVGGTWKKMVKKDSIEVRLNPFRELTDEEQGAVEREVERYGRFFGRRAEIAG